MLKNLFVYISIKAQFVSKHYNFSSTLFLVYLRVPLAVYFLPVSSRELVYPGVSHVVCMF